MNKKLETMSDEDVMEYLLSRISKNAAAAAKAGILPYQKAVLPPVNINIVNGIHYTDLNRLSADLESAVRGIDREMIITSSPAETAGLVIAEGAGDLSGTGMRNPEPGTQDPGSFDPGTVDPGTGGDNFMLSPEENEPGAFILYSNFDDGGGAVSRAEYAYFLDQFDPKSIASAVNLIHAQGRTPETEKKLQALGRRIAGFVCTFDSGTLEDGREHSARKSIAVNMNRSGDNSDRASQVHDYFVRNMSADEKKVFEHCRRWYSNQNAGKNIFPPYCTADKFSKAAAEVLKNAPDKFVESVFGACMYAELVRQPGMNLPLPSVSHIKYPALLGKIHDAVFAQEKEKIPVQEIER